MRRSLAVGVALVFVVLAGWLAWAPQVAPLPASAIPFVAVGRAESVDDGDTFVFVRGDAKSGAIRRIRVRLHGVDAPELVQRHGWAAREALEELTHRRELQIDCYKRDARGRAICRVRAQAVGDPDHDIELALLRRGLAWHYRAFAGEQTAGERTGYGVAEADARASRRGLWQHDAPMSPWDCRERLRSAATCE